MPTQNVNLSEHQSVFIRELLDGGRYKNASEVVRAGIRLLEHEEAEYSLKLAQLRAEVQKGVDAVENGRYITINNKEELSNFFEGVRKRGQERLAKKQHA